MKGDSCAGGCVLIILLCFVLFFVGSLYHALAEEEGLLHYLAIISVGSFVVAIACAIAQSRFESDIPSKIGFLALFLGMITLALVCLAAGGGSGHKPPRIPQFP